MIVTCGGRGGVDWAGLVSSPKHGYRMLRLAARSLRRLRRLCGKYHTQI